MSNNPPPPHPGTGPQGPGAPGYGPGGPGYPSGPGAPGYGPSPQGPGYGPGGRPPQGPGGPGYPAGPGGPGYPAGPGGPGYGPGGQPPQRPGGPGYGPGGQPPQGPGGPGYGPGGQPPQGPGGPGYPPGGHDTVAFGGAPAGGEPSQPRHRGRNIAIVTVVLVFLFGGGAFALYKADPFNLFTSGPQAAEAFPANTLAYAAIDLDPSAQQKVNALRFLNHFPAFRENSGLTDEKADVRKQVLGDAIDSLGCQGVTYDDSVEPWLGQKLGIGLVPAADGADPTPVVALEVTDRTEAKIAFNDLLGCGPSTGLMSVGYAFVGDYVLLTESQDVADSVATATADSSLADNDDFQDDMDSLGGLGVATAWVDLAGTLDSYADEINPELLTGGQGLDLLKQNYQRAAVTFRFESDHVEVVGSIFGDTPDTDHGDNPIVDLPDSTVFALSESGGAERVESAWQGLLDAAAAQGGDTQQEIDDFEAQTGLTLPDDLETVLGDNLLFAVDGEGLSAAAIESEDFSQFNAGARFTTDPDALNAIYDKIMSLVEQSGASGINIAKVDSDDGVSLASNDSYAESLSKLDGDLGSSAEFESVTNDAASQEFVMFFNWDAVEDQVVEAMTSQGVDQAEIDNLTPLRAMGISSETDGDYTVSTLQVSVND